MQADFCLHPLGCIEEKRRLCFQSRRRKKLSVSIGPLYDGFSFAVVRQFSFYYNSLMVSVTEILLILLAGAYAATTAARITNRIMTIKEFTGKLHVA